MDKYKLITAYLFLIIATALWGGNIVAAKIASIITLEPIKLSFYRNIVVIVILLPFIINKIKIIFEIFKINWKIICILSIFGVSIFNSFMNIALTSSSVISSSLIPSFAPSLIIIFSLIIFNSKISYLQCIGVFVSFIGFLNIIIRGSIVNLGSLDFVIGDIWMLGCVACWAFYSVMLKKMPKEIDNISFLFLIFFIGNIFVLPFYIFESSVNNSFFLNEKYSFLLVLYVGIGPALISFLLWIKSIKIIGASKSGLFLNLIPIFSSLISIIFLNEIIKLFHIVGALLIFLGIYIVNKEKLNEKNY
ncbi:MAG: DMT family transporter [Pelagibacterales bacterium]|nr:DMT family transporter [Pelagibacterales bacterium]